MGQHYRLVDRATALLFLSLATPIFVVVAILIAALHRQNPFFAARRIGAHSRPFTMWKLRTMHGTDDGLPTGGPKRGQITSTGRLLRRLRIDELPQLWNVLKGDMALIGMRPPTAWAVSRKPCAFGEILQRPPGLTGLSTVSLAKTELRMLSDANTLAHVAHLYETKILPCKIMFEDHYRRTRSFQLDMWILWETLRLILSGWHGPCASNEAKWDGNEAGLQHSLRTIRTQLP